MARAPDPRRGKGAGYAAICQYRDYQGDDCVIWPLFRDDKGYGIIGHLGKQMRAHRFMCIETHGEPPSPKHYAAHSCGNGHLGCFNPRHLSWKTPSENQEDSVRHGRARKKGTPRRKLTQEQVDQIRALQGQKTQVELGEIFGVTPRTIGEIHSGRAWGASIGPSHRRFPPDVRLRMAREARHLRDSGFSLERVAKQIGVSRLTAKRYIAELRQSES